MYPDDYDKAFSRFLDRREYDHIQQELFVMISMAFMAGWRAAGGEIPEINPPLEFFQSRLKQEEK